SSVGVPLAMGAFLAGLVVAGSEYREQALSDIIPLRETLTSLFFVSIGMLLDPRALADNIIPILGVLVAIILGKSLIVFLVGVILRFPLRACVLAAVALAQIGEFSFVLAQAGRTQGIWEGALAEIVFAAAVLSMLVTPVLLAAGPHLAAGTGRIRVLTRLLGVRSAGEAESEARALHDHLIIAGLGIAGQALARSLKRLGIRYAIVDLNSENVRQAAAEGEPAFFGDVTSTDVLQSLGIARARELVIVINDPSAAARAIRVARRLAPSLPIIVRSRYVGDVAGLMRAGATMVIPAELEAAAKVTACVLARHDQSDESIQRELEQIRELPGANRSCANDAARGGR
ncbi:MAG TPA: cation:proton antiporter, partial [Acidobacteriota bacterium]|nr:cation:proton antiporter [Acidobacteriota bacterium]